MSKQAPNGEPQMSGWDIARYYEPGFGLDNVGGVSWSDAPLPRRLHRCRPQTGGFLELGLIERCACGAIRRDGGFWRERNSRRKGK